MFCFIESDSISGCYVLSPSQDVRVKLKQTQLHHKSLCDQELELTHFLQNEQTKKQDLSNVIAQGKQKHFKSEQTKYW